MADLGLAYRPASELARMIRTRALSPVEAVRNSLARIAEVNPRLNAFCFLYEEEALAKAAEAQRAIEVGRPLGPLHGVPIALKDFTPTKGNRTTLGSHVYEHWVPERDAVEARRLLEAGAILVGKTTTPEFSYSGFTESPLWGITRNPWDASRTPGGSSGGSAAAVASGCVALADGTDSGGSIRIPAALCGIVGLKPSLGRIPMDSLPTAFDQLSHFGPLARTVEDATLFLAITQGSDDSDPQSLPPLVLPNPLPRDVKGLKLALSIDLGFHTVDEEVAANTRRAAEALADAGAQLREVALAWEPQIEIAWFQHWGVLLAACFGEALKTHRERMDPRLVALMERGLDMNAVDFKRIELLRTRQWRALAAILAEHDALLCPTMPIPAPPVGRADQDYCYFDADGRWRGFDMTAVFNFVSQCPALSVPSGFTGAGLPTGLQIVGRRFDDPTVLRIGAALEDRMPWHGRRPPI
ncbi:MAG TPA: amidase [Alphaproteobacteria bacterium]|nr:amidase [Alphaproteobacteria bacterium]